MTGGEASGVAAGLVELLRRGASEGQAASLSLHISAGSEPELLARAGDLSEDGVGALFDSSSDSQNEPADCQARLLLGTLDHWHLRRDGSRVHVRAGIR
ncbi:MAG: hypothetical protein ACOC93_03350, partial [Planctomycetota bacterium]